MIASLTLLFAALAQPQITERRYEGDWFISDTTDNISGEREVYAMRSFVKAGGTDFVSLHIRCDEGKPIFYIDWSDMVFPDQAVVTVSATVSPDDEAPDERFIFEKSTDLVNAGLRASSGTTQALIKAIGIARYAAFTVHLPSGSRTVGIDVGGTLGAWKRVSSHCPVQKMPLPPV